MGAAKKAIVTGQVEFYDINNVRVGLDGDTAIQVTIKEKNSDIYQVVPETVDKVIPIVNTNCELLMITTDNPITIKLNSGSQELTVTNKFMMIGDIDALSVSNPSTVDGDNLTCNVEVTVGNNI
jgi:hypothetical protein